MSDILIRNVRPELKREIEERARAISAVFRGR